MRRCQVRVHRNQAPRSGGSRQTDGSSLIRRRMQLSGSLFWRTHRPALILHHTPIIECYPPATGEAQGDAALRPHARTERGSSSKRGSLAQFSPPARQTRVAGVPSA